jgi:ribokinase
MSGMAAISLTPDGENAITVAQGANGELAAARILALPDELFACKALLVQLEVPLAAVAAAARRARAQGAIILLNPSPPRQDLEEAVGLSQWLVPNRLEATLLTGIADPAAAGRALLAQGPEVVCVTLGAEGALVVTRGEERQIAAPKVQAVDTTGAGDAFMGALAVALCEGRDPFGATEFAVAAGALATRRKGAQAALPTREELEDFRRHR